MPRVLRPGTIGFPIILPKGEIIRNVFLKMKIVQGNIYNGSKVILKEIFLRYGYIVP